MQNRTFHITRSGETLADVAQRFYGDSFRWPEIYALNRSAIGIDPNRMRAGLTLLVPNPTLPERAAPRAATAIGRAQMNIMEQWKKFRSRTR